ncbi:hypothetical protein SEA_WHYTU_20 [Arthrobacter phage Whytu]|uniref:Uncharacterized protein n=1 Tax=Arthrobacter phage Whytu TaxID=2713260 RepID=A0A6G8R2R8_9CAUD|nr:hypothetical protein QEX69_gp20 [Arthrobacter phage Whytu]QIN94489.1 hypothetical protein SEA_WHYTU_20 [Arthrobacter phage Whytu]
MTPDPGRVNAWALLGHLENTLRSRGVIDVDGWDEAVTAWTNTNTNTKGTK